jgi:hypothetical protein
MASIGIPSVGYHLPGIEIPKKIPESHPYLEIIKNYDYVVINWEQQFRNFSI